MDLMNELTPTQKRASELLKQARTSGAFGIRRQESSFETYCARARLRLCAVYSIAGKTLTDVELRAAYDAGMTAGDVADWRGELK